MRWFTLLCFMSLMLSFSTARADARLDQRLGLSIDQARAVDEVESRYRRAFASERQEFNRESRALRRARLAHDKAEIERLEPLTQSMQDGLIRLRAEWDDAIRAQLSPEQLPEFEQHVLERKQMAGRRSDPTY